jgi:zinc transport system substrate-binding protein
MKKIPLLIIISLALAVASCGNRTPRAGDEKTLTVTIPPIAWFVEAIAGDDFTINVMLPPGADHHIWEPLPAQINSLSGSEAFIMNGQLEFEHAWMDRFRQVNSEMQILDLSRSIELIGTEEHHEAEEEADPEGHHEDKGDDDHTGHQEDGTGNDPEGHQEAESGDDHEGHGHAGADPHFWMSPAAAAVMAKDIRDFLIGLNPASAEKYERNHSLLADTIAAIDEMVRSAVGTMNTRTVMIYHPALAYMARDYGFEQLSFEDEGKSPSPSRMKELIDIAREEKIKSIFIQAEYDLRNAESLSRETGAELIVINPMNRNWPEAVMEVVHALSSPQSAVGSRQSGLKPAHSRQPTAGSRRLETED